MCVGASGPGPESPFSCRVLPVLLWRVVMVSDQGLLHIGVFFLVGLEWSKTSMFHFAQSLTSHLLSSVKSIAESFTLKPQKTNPAPVAWEHYLQRPGNSQNVVYEAHPQSGLQALLCLFFSSYLWALDPFALGGRSCCRTRSHMSGHLLLHDTELWLISWGKEEIHAYGYILPCF